MGKPTIMVLVFGGLLLIAYSASLLTTHFSAPRPVATPSSKLEEGDLVTEPSGEQNLLPRKSAQHTNTEPDTSALTRNGTSGGGAGGGGMDAEMKAGAWIQPGTRFCPGGGSEPEPWFGEEQVVFHVAGPVVDPGVKCLPVSRSKFKDSGQMIREVARLGGGVSLVSCDPKRGELVFRDLLPGVGGTPEQGNIMLGNGEQIIFEPGGADHGLTASKGKCLVTRRLLQPPQMLMLGLKMDINRVGLQELTAIPGLGRKLAIRIIEYRDEHGDFSRIGDLTRIRGLGPAKLRLLSQYVQIVKINREEP